MPKGKKKTDGKSKKRSPIDIHFEKALLLSEDKFLAILNIFDEVGASAFSIKYLEGGGFRVGIHEEMISGELDKSPALKEMTEGELHNILASILVNLHLKEVSDTRTEKLLEDIQIENKSELFTKFYETLKSNKSYPEIKFIIEKSIQRITDLKGRSISADLKDITLNYFEIFISYIDLNSTEKRIRLEVTEKEIIYIISELKKLISKE